ncbi:MAG: branched-chain amino acid ABC transporter permease [Burkholderiales bacterium]
MFDFIQAVLDGLLFGATYSLIGIGFTLVFGVMHKLNMSYASASIGGAYAALILFNLFPNAPSLVIFLLALVTGGVIGYLIYYICFHLIPVRNENATLMSTVGMLLLIDELISHATQGMPQNYPPMIEDVMLRAGEISVRGDLILMFFVCVVCMVVLLLLLHRTRLGLATRAVAQQPVAAQLCGIRVTQVNALTFVITGILGGVAGALICSAIGTLSILISGPLTVKGLIVTVIGGLGSIPGAIVAGLMVGGLENLFQHLRGVTERDLYVMMLLFVFLIFRPDGIFAKKT